MPRTSAYSSVVLLLLALLVGTSCLLVDAKQHGKQHGHRHKEDGPKYAMLPDSLPSASGKDDYKIVPNVASHFRGKEEDGEFAIVSPKAERGVSSDLPPCPEGAECDDPSNEISSGDSNVVDTQNVVVQTSVSTGVPPCPEGAECDESSETKPAEIREEVPPCPENADCEETKPAEIREEAPPCPENADCAGAAPVESVKATITLAGDDSNKIEIVPSLKALHEEEGKKTEEGEEEDEEEEDSDEEEGDEKEASLRFASARSSGHRSSLSIGSALLGGLAIIPVLLHLV